MYKVYSENRLPILSWCEDLEDQGQALEQATNLANHSVCDLSVNLMADAHGGYGMPIGGVIACSKHVIPSAVGFDGGCGVYWILTNIHVSRITKKIIENIVSKLEQRVPLGFNWHKEGVDWEGFSKCPDVKFLKDLIPSAKRQLGTLGKNNHFLEIQQNQDGYISLMVHSGSRNLGHKVATYYNKIATEECKRWKSELPDKDLAFLPIDNKYGKEYLKVLDFILKFAKENRRQLMLAVTTALTEEVSHWTIVDNVDIHHNYAAWENFKRKNYLIHRKGAIRLRKDEIGLIPGDMGTNSYVVKGLGNEKALNSCSHGAGRIMSRTAASKTLDQKKCEDKMKDIVFSGFKVNERC